MSSNVVKKNVVKKNVVKKQKRRRISRVTEPYFNDVKRVVLFEEWAKLAKKQFSEQYPNLDSISVNDARYEARKQIKPLRTDEGFLNLLLGQQAMVAEQPMVVEQLVIEEEDSKDVEECPICLDNLFAPRNDVVSIFSCDQCNTVFHTECIYRDGKRECAVCRHPF